MLPDWPDDNNGYYFIVHQLAQWRPSRSNTEILNSNLPSGKSMHVRNRYCIFKPVTLQITSGFLCRSSTVHTRLISSWASKGLSMLTWETCRYFLSMSSSKIVMEPKTIAVALKMSFMRKSITWKSKSSTLYMFCHCHFLTLLSCCWS